MIALISQNASPPKFEPTIAQPLVPAFYRYRRNTTNIMMRIGVQIINKPAYCIAAGTPAVKQMFSRRRYKRGNTKPNTVPYGQTCSFACAINNFNLAVFLNDLAIYNIGRTSYDINGFYYPRLVI